jgi:CBS domain-containing protein
MSEVVVTVRAEAPIREVVSTMEQHHVRRVPVVDASGCCIGIISQADVASLARVGQVGELVREMSRDTAGE